MIMIKTGMRQIPESCVCCRYYLSRNRTIREAPSCRAVSSYDEMGKPISEADRVKPTKERPKWCPLREVT